MRKLVLKYGEKPDEDDMNEADWFEYQAVKKYEDEVTGEMIKDKIKNGIVSSIFPVGLASYKTAKAFGEFVADTQIAYKYKRAMDETGGKLVRKYGSGQGIVREKEAGVRLRLWNGTKKAAITVLCLAGVLFLTILLLYRIFVSPSEDKCIQECIAAGEQERVCIFDICD